MKVYRISAVTLKVRDMEKSYNFYSRLPGFKLVYGGADSSFTTFEIAQDPKMSVNLELSANSSGKGGDGKSDFGRVIFYTGDVDSLHRLMENDGTLSELATLEGRPADAPWGERYFHLRDPDGYQLSFAQPIIREPKKESAVRGIQD